MAALRQLWLRLRRRLGGVRLARSLAHYECAADDLDKAVREVLGR